MSVSGEVRAVLDDCLLLVESNLLVGRRRSDERTTSSGDDMRSGRRRRDSRSRQHRHRFRRRRRRSGHLRSVVVGDDGTRSFDRLERLFTNAQFFLLKSVNSENISIAKELCVWSTPPGNERRLSSAFRDFENVILVYSVTVSGRFHGFARMLSEAKQATDETRVPWVLPPGLNARAFTGIIPLEWISTNELPFTLTSHLTNAWNDNKPVRFGRDGQEIDPVCGEALCRLIADSGDLGNGTMLNMDAMSMFGVPPTAFDGTYEEYVQTYKQCNPDQQPAETNNHSAVSAVQPSPPPFFEMRNQASELVLLRTFYTYLLQAQLNGENLSESAAHMAQAAIKTPHIMIPVINSISQVILNKEEEEDDVNESPSEVDPA